MGNFKSKPAEEGQTEQDAGGDAAEIEALEAQMKEALDFNDLDDPELDQDVLLEDHNDELDELDDVEVDEDAELDPEEREELEAELALLEAQMEPQEPAARPGLADSKRGDGQAITDPPPAQ